jgi:hypothetical protein
MVCPGETHVPARFLSDLYGRLNDPRLSRTIAVDREETPPTMPAPDITAPAVPGLGGGVATAKPRYLFGSIFDFIALGGSFLLIAPLLFLLPPTGSQGRFRSPCR